MSDHEPLLFALPDFRVSWTSPSNRGGRRVLMESVADEGGFPACGVLSALIKDRRAA